MKLHISIHIFKRSDPFLTTVISVNVLTVYAFIAPTLAFLLNTTFTNPLTYLTE